MNVDHTLVIPSDHAQRRPRSRDDGVVRLARQYVLRYGQDASCYQILNPGLSYWLHPHDLGVVAYTDHCRIHVCAGGPVCAPDHRDQITAAFESWSRTQGRGCVWTLVPQPSAQLGQLWMGAQPWWTPSSFIDRVNRKASLRAQLNRARNKNVCIELADPHDAITLRQLFSCQAQWLISKPLPAMHFLVEPNTLHNLDDRLVFIARSHRQIEGFIVLSPISARNAWLVEQTIRHPQATNGCGELLLHHAAHHLQHLNASGFTLGLSPWSQRSGTTPTSEPLWHRLSRAAFLAHGRRFYNADFLDAFKAKFQPDWWEPLYVAAAHRPLPPRAVLAVGMAFAGSRPLRFALAAASKALRQEYQWLRQS